MRKKARTRLGSILLTMAMLLSLLPVTAGAADLTPADSLPTASGSNFFANGTPINITASALKDWEKATFDDFTATGTDAYISWDDSGTKKYIGVDAAKYVNVFGGADGRTAAVSVESTSITMTGGTIWRLFGGNYGEEGAKTDFCSVVERDVNISLSGTAVVKDLLHGAGARNTCVNGTITMEFNGVDLSDSNSKLYVNGGSWGNGNEGTRNIADGTMDTKAVADKVVIKAENSKFYLLGGGGSGSTKVNSGSVILNKCEINSLFLSGINGEVENVNVSLTDCRIENFAATNRGFVGTANVDVNSSTIENLAFGAGENCFESDSGVPDGSGITGTAIWNIDNQTSVKKAVLTPLVKRDSVNTCTATFDNITIDKEGTALPVSIETFRPRSNTTVNSYLISENSTLKLNNIVTTVADNNTLTNTGTIDMDAQSSLTVASKATFNQIGTVDEKKVSGEGTINKDYAARVGATGYDTLQAAIDDAASGATVTLLKNVDENVTIAQGADIILELNRFTLDGGKTPGEAALTNNGTVVIQDSSEAGTGTIKRSDNGPDGCYYTIRNEGTMTIKSGNICNNAGSPTEWSGSSLICNGLDNSATLTIEGGNISQDYFIAVKNDEKGTLNITGGTISSKTQAVQNWCKAEITSGKMTGDVTTWAYQGYDGDTTISGNAYIDGKVAAGWFTEGGYKVYEGIEPKVTITGGTVTGELYKSTATTLDNAERVDPATEGGTIDVSGGNFGQPVNDNFLNDSISAELRSVSNTEAPYSYYAYMADALKAAQPGDSVTAVNQDTSTTTYYTLTLQYNDNATPDSVYKVEEDTGVPLPAPNRSGYKFLGWYRNGNRVGGAGTSYPVTADMTLEARWQQIPTTPDTPSYDGGSSEPSGDYIVSVDRVSGGKVTVNPGRADKGDEVTVTVKPSEGYELDELVVTDSRGNEVRVYAESSTKFTFTMPSGTVDVKASFVKIDAGSVLDDFVDLNPNAWYAEAVEFVIEKGLMTGTSAAAFAPDASMSRAMIWTVLAAYNSYNTSGGNPWYAPGQQWAMINGVSDGTSPDGSITREQLAVMLWRAAGSPETDKSLSSYADASSVSDWAETAMAWAVDNGIITGMGGSSLAPQATATRAQVAVMLMQFVNYMED